MSPYLFYKSTPMKRLPIRSHLSVFLLLTLFLSAISPLMGQWCATRVANLPTEYFQAAQRQNLSSRNQQMKMMGITVFVVEQTVGGSNFDVQLLYDELDAVNNYFASSGLQFFFCGSPRFIQGNSIYTYGEAASQLNQRLHEPQYHQYFLPR